MARRIGYGRKRTNDMTKKTGHVRSKGRKFFAANKVIQVVLRDNEGKKGTYIVPVRVLKRKKKGTDILLARPARLNYKYGWEIINPLKTIFSLRNIIGESICISNGNKKIDGKVVKVQILKKSPDLDPVPTPPPPITSTSENNDV